MICVKTMARKTFLLQTFMCNPLCMKRNKTGLLEIPLLRQLLKDPSVQIYRRGMDSNWFYNQITPVSVSGFNPYLKKIFINQESSISNWLKNGAKNDRGFNEGDFLVREVLILLHDYLHCWCAQFIQAHFPEIGLGKEAITESNIEMFAFCHLITEAAATVGLDYWYLSTINLNDICDIGTTRKHFAVTYHESNKSEYYKYNQDINFQHPSFLAKLAIFYCSGEFEGFDIDALKKSPLISDWLSHELNYGDLQRRSTREWLSHLSGGACKYTDTGLGAPVRITDKWQFKLLDVLGKELWKKIKDDAQIFIEENNGDSESWFKSDRGNLDFRFYNLNSLPNTNLSRIDTKKSSFDFLYSQFVSSYLFESFPKEFLKILSYVKEKNDFESLVLLFKELKVKKVIPKPKKEPADIFFIN
jgi:hypothetical protein